MCANESALACFKKITINLFPYKPYIYIYIYNEGIYMEEERPTKLLYTNISLTVYSRKWLKLGHTMLCYLRPHLALFNFSTKVTQERTLGAAAHSGVLFVTARCSWLQLTPSLAPVSAYIISLHPWLPISHMTASAYLRLDGSVKGQYATYIYIYIYICVCVCVCVCVNRIWPWVAHQCWYAIKHKTPKNSIV